MINFGVSSMARNKNKNKLPESAFNPELPSEPTEETIQDTPEEIVNEEQPIVETQVEVVEDSIQQRMKENWINDKPLNEGLDTQITLATVNPEDLKDKVLILSYNMFKKSDNDLELYGLLKANNCA